MRIVEDLCFVTTVSGLPSGRLQNVRVQVFLERESLAVVAGVRRVAVAVVVCDDESAGEFVHRRALSKSRGKSQSFSR